MKFNYPIIIPHGMPDAIAEGVKKSISQVGEIVDGYADKYRGIHTSLEFTPAGKAAKYKELATEFQTAFAAVEADNDKYQSNIDQMVGSLSLPNHKELDVLSYLQQRELRDHLYTVDPLEVESMYHTAIAENDVEIISAIEMAPKFKPLVQQKLIEKLKTDRLKSLYPDEVSKIETIEAAKGLVSGALNTAKTSMEKMGLDIIVNDPVQKMAMGDK